MRFSEFKKVFQDHVNGLIEGEEFLYRVNIDMDFMWEEYLNSFPEGSNEIFRERREFDCSACRHFFKRFADVVVIRDNEFVSVWDFDPEDNVYSFVVSKMAHLVHAHYVDGVHVTHEKHLGIDANQEQFEDGTVHTWQHLYIKLPDRLLAPRGLSVNEASANLQVLRDVFYRSLTEISYEAITTVMDLVEEGQLYRGEEWMPALKKFHELYVEFHQLPEEQQNNFLWYQATHIGGSVAKIRNHSIGTLLQDLSGGMDIERAVSRYDQIMAPTNYKRPKAIFTKKMVEDAERTVMDLGLLHSLERKHAVLSDITINNVIWANRNAIKPGGALGVFDALKNETVENPKHFDNAFAMHISEVVEHVSETSSIEILLENRHVPNLVSLIAPVYDSPSLFKWNNGFSWAYNGNIADSGIKQRVESFGGNVTGAMRFSIQWNENGDNNNDFDAHCREVVGNRSNVIYFAEQRSNLTSGFLDVDIRMPKQEINNKPAVENITWNKLVDGSYEFLVHNFARRGGTSGFSAELEIAGDVYEFSYPHNIKSKESVVVAKVNIKNGNYEITWSLPASTSSKTAWNLQTNCFHPVSTLLYSPNYWDGQQGIGNLHYFFMLVDCINDSAPNGFFNEYLHQDLNKHRRVFEALGSKMKVTPTNDQLSGLGFSSTLRNSLIAKINGRLVKIIF